ncbi:MAG: trypsin-like peptidase domain-containing protein, partial [Clostridium sp.]|nr:trypsin-like peptidase domain-containing protein [Clostridium sp.]
MYNDEFDQEKDIDSSSNSNVTPEQNSEAPSDQQNPQGDNSWETSDQQNPQSGNFYNQNGGQEQYGGYNNQNTDYGNQPYQQNQNSYYQNNGQHPYPGSNPNNHPNNKWKKTVASIAIAAGIMIVGSASAFAISDAVSKFKMDTRNNLVTSSEKPEISQDTPNEDLLDTTESASVTDNSVSPVVENVMPSIVSITTTSTETVSDFFGRTYSEDVTGSGSGIIIGQNSSEVLIVTNNHVISGNDASVVVTFNDGKDMEGIVKGADPSADLAVVAVKFADISDKTKEA